MSKRIPEVSKFNVSLCHHHYCLEFIISYMNTEQNIREKINKQNRDHHKNQNSRKINDITWYSENNHISKSYEVIQGTYDEYNNVRVKYTSF